MAQLCVFISIMNLKGLSSSCGTLSSTVVYLEWLVPLLYLLLAGSPGGMGTVVEALTCESFTILKLCSFQTTSLHHQEQHPAGQAEQPCALQPSPSPLLLAKPAGRGRYLIFHKAVTFTAQMFPSPD